VTKARLEGGLLLLLWAISILFLVHVPEQDQFALILGPWILASAAYLTISIRRIQIPFGMIIVAAVAVRLLTIPGIPHLSDDIYRFIWDGRLWHMGIHPYLHLPTELVGQGSLSQGLYDQLNSQSYYSIYPPIPQAIFYVATLIDHPTYLYESVVMRAIHVAFDLGTMYLLYLWLKQRKSSPNHLALYALNPLIIIELLANLHHEVIVIFFLILTFISINRERIIIAGLAMSGAVAAKILPLLLCPAIFAYLKGRKRWLFAGGALLGCTILFLPLISSIEIFQHLMSSADLYVRKFEFNGSLYYLLRSWGYVVYGFNMIHVVGPGLLVIAIFLILYISYQLFKMSAPSFDLLIYSSLATYVLYLIASATVHPWYITWLIPFCVILPLRAPLIWSMLIMLTYVNYTSEIYQENLWIVFFEYLVVFIFAWVEISAVKSQLRHKVIRPASAT